MKNIIFRLVIVSAFAAMCVSAFAQSGYKQPPKEIMDVLNAPAIPATSVSPTQDRIAILTSLRYPPISELAQPMLRLAGVRINPNTNGQHRQPYFVSLTLKNVSDGRETPVALPAGAQIISPQWSPDGKYIAAGNVTSAGIELWIVDTASGKAQKVKNVLVNTVLGSFSWEDSRTLAANLVPSKRGPSPAYQNLVPNEPNIQETSGRTGAVQTFQDLLRSPNDERLFEYYATSQPALIDVTGKVREIGTPAIYDDFGTSPDGKYVLVTRIERPFSYLFPYSRFPKKVEVWDSTGKLVYTVANLPLQDSLPVQGVPTGPRSVSWIPTEPATLMWAEALDGGDPRKKITPRDRLVTFAAPFSGQPAELVKIEQRYQGRQFGEKDGLMLFYDYNRDNQHRRMFMTDYRDPSNVKLISDLSVNDRYHDIGQPITKVLPSGVSVVRQNGDQIFLTGTGASPQGDRPFFRAMNIKTNETREIFRSGADEYEAFVAMTDDEGMNFITRKESITEPPNLFLRQVCPPGKIC
ncbi:MAG TPA: hypothetical protein VHL50_05270, partial [Pyrinomonadaceae bacterium]|nr:hypothetical protein [Pyrinomonadaceae bacterium]